MAEKETVEHSPELEGVSTRDGLPGEEKEAELPPAILPSYDDAGLGGLNPLERKEKKR